MAQHQAQVRKQRAHIGGIKESQQEFAEEQSQGRLADIHSQDDGHAFHTVDPVEIGQTGIVTAVIADIIMENEIGRHNGAVDAAQKIGHHGNDHKRKYEHYSLSPF